MLKHVGKSPPQPMTLSAVIFFRNFILLLGYFCMKSSIIHSHSGYMKLAFANFSAAYDSVLAMIF